MCVSTNKKFLRFNDFIFLLQYTICRHVETTECRYECNHNLSWWLLVVICTFWGNFKSQSISGLPLHLPEICENNYSIIITPTQRHDTHKQCDVSRGYSLPSQSRRPDTWSSWRVKGRRWLVDLVWLAGTTQSYQTRLSGRSHELFLLIINFGFHFENLVKGMVHLLTKKNSWG